MQEYELIVFGVLRARPRTFTPHPTQKCEILLGRFPGSETTSLMTRFVIKHFNPNGNPELKCALAQHCDALTIHAFIDLRSTRKRHI